MEQVAGSSASGAPVVVFEDNVGDKEENSKRKRAKKYINFSRFVNCVVDRFSATLNESDDRQRAVDRERLDFEGEV